MLPVQELQTLYGIQQGINPYVPQVLNPLRTPAHLQLVVRVQPYDVLDQVETYLEECINQERTAFVLVCGESGTGRTSIANTVLALYRDRLISNQTQRGARFFVPDMPALNEDPYNVYSKWIYSLRNALYFRRGQLSPPDDFFSGFDKVYEARTSDDFATKFQQALGDISYLLINQPDPAGFGLLLEGVPNPKFITPLKEMLAYARAACVLTVPSNQPEVVSAFNSAFPDQEARLVRLTGIQGKGIKHLLEVRWTGANPPPFQEDGLEQVFQQPTPIGKVLNIVSSLLYVRAREKKGVAPWPGNQQELLFTQDDLQWGAQFFSSSWR